MMLVLRIVVFDRLADREPFPFGDISEVARYRPEDLLVDQRLIAERPQITGDIKKRRIGGAVGERRKRGIDDLDAELDRFQAAERP
jgi:hypothetical protein